MSAQIVPAVYVPAYAQHSDHGVLTVVTSRSCSCAWLGRRAWHSRDCIIRGRAQLVIALYGTEIVDLLRSTAFTSQGSTAGYCGGSVSLCCVYRKVGVPSSAEHKKVSVQATSGVLMVLYHRWPTISGGTASKPDSKLRGSEAAWVRGCVAAWLRGCEEARLRGYASERVSERPFGEAVRHRGSVAAWQWGSEAAGQRSSEAARNV